MRNFNLLVVEQEHTVTGHSRPYNTGAYWNSLNPTDPKNVWGLPATVPLLNQAPVPFYKGEETTDAYKLLLEVFSGHCPWWWAPGYKKMKLNQYLKNGVAFTDHTYPPAWKQIVTCGNVLYPTGRTKRTAGELYYEILQLKYARYGVMRRQLNQFPLLETLATISRRESHEEKVINFPQTGDNDVPALLFCREGTNFIKASRVRMLARDEPIPPVYHP